MNFFINLPLHVSIVVYFARFVWIRKKPPLMRSVFAFVRLSRVQEQDEMGEALAALRHR